MALGDFLRKIFSASGPKDGDHSDGTDTNRTLRYPENDFGQTGLPRNIEDDLLKLNHSNPMQNFNFHFTIPGGPESHDHDVDDDIFEVEQQQILQQLDGMMNSIFKGFNIQDIFPNQSERHAEDQHMNQNDSRPNSLRDKMLQDPKDNGCECDGGIQIFNIEPFHEAGDRQTTPWFTPLSIFEELWRYPFHDPSQQPNHKMDHDLDDEVLSGASRLDDIFADKQNELETKNTQPTGGSSFFWSSSSTKHTLNGGLECHKTVRDSQGNEEVTVTRTLGDQSHSYTKKKDSDGIEETTENFINMDEANLKTFNEIWQREDTPMLLFEPGDKDNERHNISGGLYNVFKDLLFPWKPK